MLSSCRHGYSHGRQDPHDYERSLKAQTRNESDDDAEDQAANTSRYKRGRRFLERSAPAPLSDSGESAFERDVREDIKRDLEEAEAVKQNGGKKPRKKQAEATDAQKQTERTRRMLKKGERRLSRDAFCVADTIADRPRQRRKDCEMDYTRKAAQSADEAALYALIATVKQPPPLMRAPPAVDIEVLPSDSSSSDGSVDSNNVDELSDYSQQVFWLRKRRRGQWKHHVTRKGKSKAKEDLLSSHHTQQEEADVKHFPLGVPAATNAVRIDKAEPEEEDVKPVILPNLSDSDCSEDVSPLDVEAYQEQITRRKRRELKSAGQKSPTIKAEDLDEPKVFVRSEAEQLPIDIDSNDTEDEDMPDLPIDDPRYLAWTQKLKQKAPLRSSSHFQPAAPPPAGASLVKREPDAKVESAGSLPSVPYQQKDSRPHFEIKSVEQAAIGAHKLGTDENGRDVEIPASINRFLRSYQRDGVRFFWEHYRRGEGGLLGDDMGLGKTIQVISFLTAIMHHRCVPKEQGRRLQLSLNADNATDMGPTALVIAPASVVDNWAREINTWTYLTADVYVPAQEKTRRLLKDFKRGRIDVVICGMDAARNHIGEIAHLDFSCIFIDEVHRVKNPLSQTSTNFQTFLCKRRFGLTGTAMQNRYAEMHVVLDWCFPGRLGDRAQWKDYVESPLKEAQRKDATQKQLAVGRVGHECRHCVQC